MACQDFVAGSSLGLRNHFYFCVDLTKKSIEVRKFSPLLLDFAHEKDENTWSWNGIEKLLRMYANDAKILECTGTICGQV